MQPLISNSSGAKIHVIKSATVSPVNARDSNDYLFDTLVGGFRWVRTSCQPCTNVSVLPRNASRPLQFHNRWQPIIITANLIDCCRIHFVPQPPRVDRPQPAASKSRSKIFSWHVEKTILGLECLQTECASSEAPRTIHVHLLEASITTLKI
jgi:hypothetical protein